jgi:hypothetical protein
VLAAMVAQVVSGELPCSHCNLERLGYFTLALGPALNLRFGIRPSHYGISLAGAMAVEVLAAANRRRFPSANQEVPPNEVLLRSMDEDRQWAVRTILTDERPPFDTVN